ncbi:MAG: sensor histidine kinase [Myxococcales bacterium]|nr:sensor histidine kinase [Polyangiaceae bacterium]MDW8250313.1 sensor histidine kinase [Myxococcales bacterium]
MPPLDPKHPRFLRLVSAGVLGAGALHETRNLLAVASTSLFLARQDRSDDGRLLRHLEKASAMVVRAQEVAGAILSLAQGDPLPLSSCRATEILTLVHELVPCPPSLLLTETVTPEDLAFRCHLLLFPQALANLYLNAIEAQRNQEHSAIRTSIRFHEGLIEVLVEDDGPGIPTTVRATLFEPLVSGKADGTGLGLAVVRAIIEAHSGSIEVLPGERGAAFLVRLPA